MSSNDSDGSSAVSVPSVTSHDAPPSSRPDTPRSQSDSGLSAEDIHHPPSDLGAPRTPPPSEPQTAAYKDFDNTPQKTSHLNLNRFAIKPLANRELRPSLVNPSDTMSRWHQFSIETWMDKFSPGDRKFSEDLTPLPQNIHDELKAITKEVLDKWFPKEGECFDTLGREAKMYAPINALIQGILDKYEKKDLEALDTANHKTDDGGYDRHSTVPDCGIYRVNDQARRATVLLPKHLKKSRMDPELKAKRAPHLARRSWHWIDVLIEAKWSSDLSAFYFDDRHGIEFLRQSQEGNDALGQLAEYMSHIFRCQHRMFAYAIYIFRGKARFLYFDRTGAAVSDWCAFETDLYLQQFIYRLLKANDAERGHDPTATLVPVDSQDARDFRASVDSLGESTLLRKWVVDSLKSECPIYKLETTSVSQHGASEAFTSRYFLVGRPFFTGDALVGRCTRGYIAFDPIEKNHCFLKDSWRPVVVGRTRPEHEVYERLYSRLQEKRKSITSLPTVLCGGDLMLPVDNLPVDNRPTTQTTRVHVYIPAVEGRSPPVPRNHYRLVLREVGVPLDKFPNFKSLVGLTIQALDIHANAWEHAGVLHRDISIGNILMKLDWKTSKVLGSMLCDWDLSKYKEELSSLGKPTQPDRTGTWEFKSALSLLFPWKAYEVADDVESFVHVLNYLILKYHPTSFGDRLEAFVNQFFAYYKVHNAIHFGGDAKWQYMRQFRVDEPPYYATGPGEEGVQELINSLADLCHNHYLLKRPWVEEELSNLNNPHPFPSMKLRRPANPKPPAIESPDPTPVSISDFELDPSYGRGRTSTSKPTRTLPKATSSIPSLTQPPPLDITLQDHRGLWQALMNTLNSGKWDKSDKVNDQFEVFREPGKPYKSPFRSNFSTSEYFILADSGSLTAAKRTRRQRKAVKRARKASDDDDGDTHESEREDDEDTPEGESDEEEPSED